MKADQSTTYTKIESDARFLNLAGGSLTGNLDTQGHRVIVTRNPTLLHDVVNKETLDTGLNTKKNTGTFDTKIQNSTEDSSLDCSGSNQIDIKVNGATRGYLYQPVG